MVRRTQGMQAGNRHIVLSHNIMHNSYRRMHTLLFYFVIFEDLLKTGGILLKPPSVLVHHLMNPRLFVCPHAPKCTVCVYVCVWV